MIFDRSITVVDSHTVGEPFRLATGGIPPIIGKTMPEKLAYFQENYDHLRTGMMHEPRGHADMFGGILTDPVNEDSDFGILFCEGAGYLNMCGHGTIAAITIILETGLKTMEYPTTEIKLDSPAGQLTCVAYCDNNKVTKVSLTNVPAFFYKKDLSVEVDGKEYKFDVSFGGSFFALVNEQELGMEISVENLPKLKYLADKFEHLINEKYDFAHPNLPHIKTVDLIEFYGKSTSDSADAKNVVIFGGAVDRSPCGTGTSAKLAALSHYGKLNKGEKFVYESIIGSQFEGEIVDYTTVGEYDAVVPMITGSAYIVGFNNLVWDITDPFYDGFKI